MLARIFGCIFCYRFVSCVVGVFLVAASISKIYQFVTADYEQLSLFDLVLSGAELVLATWLIIGVYPTWSRLAAVTLFIVFANVALSQALAEKTDCGCFGRISISPWLILVVDLTFVLLLSLAPGNTGPATEGKRQKVALAVVTAAVVIGSLALAGLRFMPWGNSVDPQSPEARRLLARVCNSIEKNHNAFGSLEFSLQQIVSRPNAVASESKIHKDSKGKITAITSSSPRSEKLFHYVIRGVNVRCDDVSSDSAGHTISVFQGRCLDYDPTTKRAVGKESEVAVNGLNESIDPRCLGFEGPISSISNWIKRSNVTKVQAYQDGDDEGVEINVKVTKKVRENLTINRDWSIRFSARYEYLPIRIEEYFDSGDRSRLVVLSYQNVLDGAWFLKAAKAQRWSKPLAGKPAVDQKPFAIIDYEVQGDLVANKEIPDSAFDIKLPKGVNLALATKKLTDMNFKPEGSFFDLLVEPAAAAATVRRRGFWLFVLGLDAAILVIAIFFRKRIQL